MFHHSKDVSTIKTPLEVKIITSLCKFNIIYSFHYFIQAYLKTLNHLEYHQYNNIHILKKFMSTLPPYFIVSCSQTHLPNHILPTNPKHLFDFFIGQQLYHHRTRNVIIVIFVFFDIQQKYQNPVTHAHIRVLRVFRCSIITYFSIFHHVTTDAPPPRVPSFRGVRRSRGVCIQKQIPKVIIDDLYKSPRRGVTFINTVQAMNGVASEWEQHRSWRSAVTIVGNQ